MSTVLRPAFDATEVQGDDARTVAERRRGMAPLGAVPRRNGSATATEAMFDLARVGPGCRVLDVAAGAGEQSLAAARRVGPDGHVLATDIAPALLEYAAADAHAAGLSNIETRELDGEALDVLPAASFDVVISRVGLIYFPDQQRALAGMRHALKPGGRVAAIVYSTPDRNAVLLDPGVDHPPPRAAAAAAAGPARAVLARRRGRARQRRSSGPASATSRCARCDSPVRLPSAAECVRFERESFGALHQMMAGLDEAERAQVGARSKRAAPVRGRRRFVGPCEMLVGVGTV